MRALEITTRLQGQRPDDYHWATDGELAYIPGVICDCPDCGCDRGFVGMTSRGASTTARVVERPGLTIDVLATELASSLAAGGWLGAPDSADPMVAELLDATLEMIHGFPVGTVLELTRDGIGPRLPAGAAGRLMP